MDASSPSAGSSQTYRNTRPSAASSPCQQRGGDDAVADRLSRPPLRQDPAAYAGADQPAWLERFIMGELTPLLDTMETARSLWREFNNGESFEAWLDNKNNWEEANYVSSGENGIDTYENWCVQNNEPGALFWLLEKTGRKYFNLNVKSFSKANATIWLETLASDVSIQRLVLDEAALDLELAMPLKHCLARKQNLVSLELNGLRFTDGDLCPVIHLAEGIASNTDLKRLALCRCQMNGADWTIMMEMVRDHPSLESICIAKSKITTKDVTTITRNIQANPHISELSFQTLNLPPKGVPAIAAFLASDSQLKKLEMVNVGLDTSGGCAIAKALMSNTTLAELSLASNRLDAEFATACRRLLAHNRHLAFLDLSDNQLGNQGALVMADALRKNQALLVLSLNENTIKESGGLAIASMLASNASLSGLRLENNPCGEEVGAAMWLGLETNTTLEYLSNDECGFSDQARASIENITTRNREARTSRERDAMLFSRHGASLASWLPPEIGASVMNHLLMRSDSREHYESKAAVVEMALNALANSPQDKGS